MRGLTALAGIVALAVIAGCSLPFLQDEVDRRPTRFEQVEIADDRMSVRVDFVGAAEFDPEDICTARYEATTDVVDGELVVGVFKLEHPKPVREGDFCTLEGYQRSLVIELDEPFEGDVVRDLAGVTFGP